MPWVTWGSSSTCSSRKSSGRALERRNKALPDRPRSQLDKFQQAARELETDEDPKRFEERLRKLVKHKPVEKPERS